MPNANTSPSVAPIMPLTDTATTPKIGSTQQPTPLIEQLPQDDVAFLQTSADALLHKITTLRGEKPCDLNPQAPPFTPQPSQSSTTNHCLVVTTAEVHPQPKEVPLNASDEKPQPTYVPPIQDAQHAQPNMESLDNQPTERSLPTRREFNGNQNSPPSMKLRRKGNKSPRQPLYFNKKTCLQETDVVYQP